MQLGSLKGRCNYNLKTAMSGWTKDYVGVNFGFQDSQDRIRSFWTRKKDLQDEVVKNNLWSFEVSNCGTTRKDWKFKEDLCHAFIALKGLRSEPIAYREFECGWKTWRLVFWYKFWSSYTIVLPLRSYFVSFGVSGEISSLNNYIRIQSSRLEKD